MVLIREICKKISVEYLLISFVCFAFLSLVRDL